MAANGFDDDQTRSFINLVAGTIVSHYKIISKIGAGGMGEVYLAEDTQLDRKVALKFLPPHLSQDEAARARFTREAKAAAKLDHPNIVQVFEVGEFQGRPFFAMAHIDGKSLRKVIREGKLSINEAVEYTKQICEGLNKAHESGIIHRDIKPANIIIDRDNKARILDFGLATVSGEDKLTKTGSTLGTVGYMSPEQIEGKAVDHRSDLFSVGIILYEMLTGRRPFEGDNEAAVSHSVTTTNPEPIARYKSGTTGELQQIVDKALSKDPSLRYQHADGMLADLKRLDVTPTSQTKSRFSLWLSLALVVIIIGVCYLYFSKSSTKESFGSGWDNSVAVLIFRNMTKDPDQDYFCENMTDEIITRLGTIDNLKVTSLQSMLRFKDSSTNIKDIGRQLQVDHILTGTLQLSGDSIRIRTHLIRVSDDAPIWSDKYTKDMKLNSIFEIQDEISQAIASVLEVTLLDTSKIFASRQGTDNIEAYNAYAKGRHFWRKRSQEGLDLAIKHFENAVELDPYYAAAWSGLADAWLVKASYGYIDHYTGYAKADTFSLRAIELDPNLAEAQASRGELLFEQKKLKQSEQHFLKAIKLNNNYSWGHLWYSSLLGYMGEDVKQKDELDKAYKLDPLSPSVLGNLGNYSRKKGEFSQAVNYFKQLLEIAPNFSNGYFQLALSYIDLKDTSKAFETVDRMLEKLPDDFKSYTHKASILRNLQRFDEAEEVYKKALELFPDIWTVHYGYAIFLDYDIDEYNAALKEYEQALSLDSMQAGLLRFYAYCLLEVGKIDDAVKLSRRALELAPYDPAAYTGYARIIGEGQKKYEEAIEYLEKALELNPRDVNTLWNIADMYSKVGNYEKALEMINKRLELDKSWMWSYLLKGNYCFALGMLDSAIANYSFYHENRPFVSWVTLRLGDLYTAAGKYIQADSIYTELAKANDTLGNNYRTYRVRPLLRQGKFNQALTDLQNGIELDSIQFGLCLPMIKKYIHRAKIYLNFLNAPNKALDELDNAVQLSESVEGSRDYWSVLITSLRAEAMAKSGDPIEAEKYLQKELEKIDSTETVSLREMLISYSRILRLQGKPMEGVRKVEGLVEAINVRFQIGYCLGLCYLQEKDYNNAIQWFERSLQTNNGTYFLYFGETVLTEYYLGQAYEGRGQKEQANEHYEKFLHIWKNADAGLKSVEDAKERLAKFRGTI